MSDARPLAALTQAVFGESLTLDQVFARLAEAGYAEPDDRRTTSQAVWIGSVGYERHKICDDFARRLRDAGVERLVDVRQLPMSRRRGYAKTALGEAMSSVGIEYCHRRDLGNPKAFRDLYKSGDVARGRAGYERYLHEEQQPALAELEELLRSKRTALMCVEHDPTTCHRTVILEALRSQRGLELEVAELS